MNSATNQPAPNVGYEPALTGTQTTPTPYQVDIVDPANAPTTSKKMTVLTTDATSSGYTNAPTNLDRQMTYYSESDEYFFEFDTSACGTGTNACFFVGNNPSPPSYRTRTLRKLDRTWKREPRLPVLLVVLPMATRNQLLQPRPLVQRQDGYLTIGAQDGPGMNLVFLYNSGAKEFATVGIGTTTGIDAPLSGGDAATASMTYGYSTTTQAYKFAIPGDITGDFGSFKFNSTGSTNTANRMCVTSNGWYYFYRSVNYDRCSPAYYAVYGSTSSYRWSGFALGTGERGVMDGRRHLQGRQRRSNPGHVQARSRPQSSQGLARIEPNHRRDHLGCW